MRLPFVPIHPGRLSPKDPLWDPDSHRERMLFYETELWESGIEFIAGVDEAGAGALAGPVVAGAVILPEGIFIDGVDDSKLLTPKKREVLYKEILRLALAVGIGKVSPGDIDKLNIYNASILAMKRAILKLSPAPQFILSDARRLSDLTIPCYAIKKGDRLSHSIASASIVAKVFRDRLMRRYSKRYPRYGFEIHKGYGTRLHKRAVRKFGALPIHRKSFTLR